MPKKPFRKQRIITPCSKKGGDKNPSQLYDHFPVPTLTIILCAIYNFLVCNQLEILWRRTEVQGTNHMAKADPWQNLSTPNPTPQKNQCAEGSYATPYCSLGVPGMCVWYLHIYPWCLRVHSRWKESKDSTVRFLISLTGACCEMSSFEYTRLPMLGIPCPLHGTLPAYHQAWCR